MSQVSSSKKWIIAVLAIVVVAAGIAAAVVFSEKDVYNTREVRAAEATVMGKESSGGYFLQVSVAEVPASSLYAQTTSEFYQQVSPGQKVGVLVGLVDRYKVRESWNKLQLIVRFDATEWEVLSLYPSLAEAQEESRPAAFTTTGTLKERIKSLDGRYFFLIDAGGRMVMAEVSPEYYSRYIPSSTPADSFELQFEGVGDFNRFVKITKP